MSEDFSKKRDTTLAKHEVVWSPIAAVVFVVLMYFVTRFIAAQLVAIYPSLHHIAKNALNDWINKSIPAQFVYVVLAEGMSIVFVWKFLRHYHQNFKVIGLLKPKLEDIGYALTGFAIYFPVFIVSVKLLSSFFHGLNVNQAQQIGFQNPAGTGQLLLVFLSLVVVPPIAEELLFRGFLYTSLKTKLSFLWAGLLTSLLFAAPHLLEGGNSGLLWIGAIDTFVLSSVLVWLREKTGRLSSGMGLHALKNFVAFASLFLLHVH